MLQVYLKSKQYLTMSRFFNWGFRGKTFWDFMQLFLLPMLIAVSGYAFQHLQQGIANEHHQEEALQEYYENISELMFDRKLRNSNPDDEVRSLARAKTLTLLRQLDDERQGLLVLFLKEAKLITLVNQKSQTGIISLSGANLEGADLNHMDLRDSSFWYSALTNAELMRADLRNANLSKADLKGANFLDANLDNADLLGAQFCNTTMSDGSIRNDNC